MSLYNLLFDIITHPCYLSVLLTWQKWWIPLSQMKDKHIYTYSYDVNNILWKKIIFSISFATNISILYQHRMFVHLLSDTQKRYSVCFIHRCRIPSHFKGKFDFYIFRINKETTVVWKIIICHYSALRSEFYAD